MTDLRMKSMSEEEGKINQKIKNMSNEEIAELITSSAESDENKNTMMTDDDDNLNIGESVYSSDISPDLFEEEDDDIPEESIPTDEFINVHIGNETNHQFRGNRKRINYGFISEKEKLERKYHALQSAKFNGAILEGVVVAARMINVAPGLEEILFTVLPTKSEIKGQEIYITGSDMTKILQWDEKEESKALTTNLRRRFAKGWVDAEIQFCITSITVTDPNAPLTEYFVRASRVVANKMLQNRYFKANISYEVKLEEGDIVNGKVLAVFPGRVVYSVAGIDLYLHPTIPYITGMSRIVPGISGKQLFEQNEDKDCMIESFTWDDKIKEVGTLRVSFYQPIREQLLEKIKAMKVNDIYSATIMRYIPSKDNGRTTYIVAKTDIGVEVVCLLPNWNRPPVVMDSVKVKIVAIAPQGQESLVLGAIKR
jgi:hypothetical protein